MRLKSIAISDVPPVKRFEVSDLADTVVLAGPNGVGKTRLVKALIQFFRSPSSGNIRLVVEATTPTESRSWGKDALDLSLPDDIQKMAKTLRNARKRTNWQSSVVQFESDRTIQQIRPFAFTWAAGDPWDENYGWDATLAGLQSRFEDTIHSLFRKVQSRRDRIARQVETALKSGPVTVSPDDYPDPLHRFKEAFSQLLSPKTLLDPDPQNQKLMFAMGPSTFGLDQLSSGEQEVVNIVFDFLLRGPSDCIVFFDEPELHLHPELSYKLLQTLKTAGERNQFVFCTHSPDIITASLDNSVVFVAPPRTDGSNQAVVVREDDETNQALRLLGHSVGIVALGKKLVLIEGQAASLDKQVYGAILKDKFPDFVLVPSGGKGVVTSFSHLTRTVLDRTLWGVEFFMVCDRDAVPLSRQTSVIEAESSNRLRVLRRYHLENYFLDTRVLSEVFAHMETDDSWLRAPDAIDERLREIALTQVPYAVALQVAAEFRDLAGNIDIMPKGCYAMSEDELTEAVRGRLTEERTRLATAIDDAKVASRIHELFGLFSASLDTGQWRVLLPGRQILNIFASQTRFDSGRLKTMYIRAAQAANPGPFGDLIRVFEDFTRVTTEVAAT